jgi:hypothetical protein
VWFEAVVRSAALIGSMIADVNRDLVDLGGWCLSR